MIFLYVLLFAVLIAGLFNPQWVSFRRQTFKRTQLVASWFCITIFLFLVSPDRKELSADARILLAQTHMSEGKYLAASDELNRIDEHDSLYQKAQLLRFQADSLQLLKESAEQQKAAGDEIARLRDVLESDLITVDAGIDFNMYRGNINALQSELLLFSQWGEAIMQGEATGDPEVQRLATQLKTKVVAMQEEQLPILRKEYVKVLAARYWEHDVEVSIEGNKNQYINFTGGIFAANRNKKEYQEGIDSTLATFRFSQARYRWYQGQSDYDYWKIAPGNDSALITTY